MTYVCWVGCLKSGFAGAPKVFSVGSFGTFICVFPRPPPNADVEDCPKSPPGAVLFVFVAVLAVLDAPPNRPPPEPVWVVAPPNKPPPVPACVVLPPNKPPPVCVPAPPNNEPVGCCCCGCCCVCPNNPPVGACCVDWFWF